MSTTDSPTSLGHPGKEDSTSRHTTGIQSTASTVGLHGEVEFTAQDYDNFTSRPTTAGIHSTSTIDMHRGVEVSTLEYRTPTTPFKRNSTTTTPQLPIESDPPPVHLNRTAKVLLLTLGISILCLYLRFGLCKVLNNNRKSKKKSIIISYTYSILLKNRPPVES